MAELYVAIDLETTGFDSVSDRIIEIGAVRFDRAGYAERFETFVQPGRPIPSAVVALTSIRDEDVASAPRIEEVLPQVTAFLDGCVVVGHNVQFDLGFLAAAGLDVAGVAQFDTYELASPLLPQANRMQLGAIAETLGIEMPVAHRALADADATREVFLRLLTRLEALPRAVIAELLTIAEQGQWPVLPLVRAAFDEASESGTGEIGDAEQAAMLANTRRGALVVTAAPASLPALTPKDEPVPVTAADVNALFALAAQRLPGFEVRASQVTMSQAVARNIEDSGHLAVEAGTGTGKSLAYLLPALLHAVRNDDRVVVSTHTINLQDQLATHDLPAAVSIVQEYAHLESDAIQWTVLKGRSNYLCLERWAEARAEGAAQNRSEARLHARIAVWLPTTETGELGEIAVPAAERRAWDALSAGDTDCLSRRCAYVRDRSCFLLRARARAVAAHVVVVNHALLLANAVSGEQVLPPYRHVVIDEAHRLEGVATQQYGTTLALRDLAGHLEGTGATVIRLREVASALGDAGTPIANAAERLAGAAASALSRVPDAEATLRAFAAEFADERATGERTVPVTAARRSQPAWDEAEQASVQLDVTLQYLGDRVSQARSVVVDLEAGQAPAVERTQGMLAGLAEAIASARSALHAAVLRSDGANIVWVTDGDGGVRAHASPREVAGRLASDLYAGRESVTATSATLTAQGRFDFSVQSLGLVEPDTLTVPSPFDYRRAVLAIVVDDIPTPEQPGYAEAVHRVLGAAAAAAGGRTLGLFTSHASVRAAAGALSAPLAAQGIGVLAHNVDGSPARLLRQLVEQPRTLVLGTAAFWEGVDVRGEALSQIAIARLPFPVPSDPIYAGRAPLYDDPFNEFALPQAVLRFRQGFGRLIRGSEDRGVFLLLDRRVVSRGYGEAFLDALPECEVRRLPAAAVGEAVARWLT